MNDFERAIRETLPAGLTCDDTDTLQINLGRRCNLSCVHCHLECSPLRREAMTEPTMESIIDILSREKFRRVDITGGAPELHPLFRKFVDRICRTGNPVQVRTGSSCSGALTEGDDPTPKWGKINHKQEVGRDEDNR